MEIGEKKTVRMDPADSGKTLAENYRPCKKDAGFLYRRAMNMINTGNTGEGMKFLKKTLKADPSHREALKALSLCYVKSNNARKAINLLYGYLEKNYMDDEILNLMGVYLVGIREIKLAEMFFKKVLEMNPGNESVKKNLIAAGNACRKAKKGGIPPGYSYLARFIKEGRNAGCTVALCMIVKNEHKNLQKCLESVKDAVSEIIVVDTGSDDDSKEIAKRFGAKVIEYEWDDDFSKARNKSIEHATSDWILFLDADEYLKKSGISFLKNLQKVAGPAAYYVKIINISDNLSEGQVSEHYSLRLFNNGMGFEFEGCIHEQLRLAEKGLDYARLLSGISIKHTGYCRSVMAEKNKNERNYRLLSAAIGKDPDNAFNHYNMGVYYYSNRKYAEAVESFDTMVGKLHGKVVSYLPFAYSFQSSSLVSMKRYQRAVKCAEKALKIAPHLKDARYNLANAQFYLGDYENAIENFSKACRDDDKEIFLGGTGDIGVRSWKSYNGIGAAYIRMKKYREAAESLEKAYREEKKSPMIISNLIIAYKNLGRTGRIKTLLRESGEVPFSVSGAQQLANHLMHLSLAGQAICMLKNTLYFYGKRGLESDSENMDVSLLKGNIAGIFFSRGKYKRAAKWYGKYFEASRRDGEASKKYGITNYVLGDCTKAEKYLKDALEIDYEDWEIHYNLGMLKMKMERFDEAKAYFRKSVELNPGNIETYLNLGKIQIILKEYSGASMILEHAIGMDKKNSFPELLFTNSGALFNMGRYGEAADNLLKYMEYDSRNPAAFNRLGLCLYKAGRFEEAVNLFSNASELNNKNPDYFINLGNALRKNKRYPDAKLAFQCAIILDGKNSLARTGYESVIIEEKLAGRAVQ